MPISVTFDLEDSRSSRAQEERFGLMTERFLEFADRLGFKATFFVVGELGRTHPELVRRVAEAGHEIALHGLRHVPLGDVGRTRLQPELAEGRVLLEDAGQAAVTGFRAPIFSLTPGTAWAVDAIAAAGFQYSSSVLPARNPLHGWPGAPTTPFRWRNGVVELPCPVAGVGPLRVPFLGGIYLRYLPPAVVRRLQASFADDAVLWSYLHPYDLDPEEPFFVMPHTGWLTSRILHTRRASSLRCLERLLEAAGGAGPPLGSLVAGLGSSRLRVVA